MKILFDHQTFTNQKYGGISRYFANLYYGLDSIPNVAPKLGLLATNNGYIDKSSLPLSGFIDKLVKKQSRRNKYNKWYCRYLLKQGDYDIFHPTYYNPYFLNAVKKPFVITVHDMIHELYPQYFAQQDAFTAGYKAEVINRADHIIAISECTKRDLQKFYAIPDNKITVVYHGYKMGHTSPLTSATTSDKYLLYVGDRDNYKNFNTFAEAVAPLLITNNLKLICAGGGAFNDIEKKFLAEMNIADRTDQRYVTDEVLAALYSNAEAFIYPSLYEGFGLPVLEAFNNNCPVIMSSTSSLPEVGGEAAVYFNPTDQRSIANAIQQVVSNKMLQDRLRVLGKQQLDRFNFSNTLQQTINVYKHVMLNSR